MHMMERVGHSYQVDGWLLVPEVCSFASLKKILPIIIALFPFYLDFVSWNTLMHSNVYLQRCLSMRTEYTVKATYFGLLLFAALRVSKSLPSSELSGHLFLNTKYGVKYEVIRIINVSITPESHYCLLSTLKNNTFYMMILPEMLFYMVMYTTL